MLASLFSETEVLYQTLAEDYVQDSWISIWRKKKPRSSCLLLSWAFSVRSLTLGQMAPPSFGLAHSFIFTPSPCPFLTFTQQTHLLRWTQFIPSILSWNHSYCLSGTTEGKAYPHAPLRLPNAWLPHTQEGRGKGGCPAPHSPTTSFKPCFSFLNNLFL